MSRRTMEMIGGVTLATVGVIAGLISLISVFVGIWTDVPGLQGKLIATAFACFVISVLTIPFGFIILTELPPKPVKRAETTVKRDY